MMTKPGKFRSPIITLQKIKYSQSPNYVNLDLTNSSCFQNDDANERLVDLDSRVAVTSKNQDRMTADPLETFFMNMSYDLMHRDDDDEDGSANIQCNPS